MIRPASTRPSATAGRIWSNGMTTTGTSLPRQSWSVKNAVVSLPGTAIVRPCRSSSVAGVARDQGRAIPVAHARARGQQRVPVGEVGEGMDAHGRDFQLTVQGAVVERLDVLELMDEPQAAGVEPSCVRA